MGSRNVGNLSSTAAWFVAAADEALRCVFQGFTAVGRCMALYQWELSYSEASVRETRRVGDAGYNPLPPTFNPPPRHFMIGLIAKFVNAVGRGDIEERDDAVKNKCNENLCSTGHHDVRNVNYYLRPDQVFEWFANKSKYRVQIYVIKVI